MVDVLMLIVGSVCLVVDVVLGVGVMGLVLVVCVLFVMYRVSRVGRCVCYGCVVWVW